MKTMHMLCCIFFLRIMTETFPLVIHILYSLFWFKTVPSILEKCPPEKIFQA